MPCRENGSSRRLTRAATSGSSKRRKAARDVTRQAAGVRARTLGRAVLGCGTMKSSSTRRVLKSVVGPALGATLGALVIGGCAKEEAKPAPTTTQPDTKAEPATPPPAEPPAA